MLLTKDKPLAQVAHVLNPIIRIPFYSKWLYVMCYSRCICIQEKVQSNLAEDLSLCRSRHKQVLLFCLKFHILLREKANSEAAQIMIHAQTPDSPHPTA